MMTDEEFAKIVAGLGPPLGANDPIPSLFELTTVNGKGGVARMKCRCGASGWLKSGDRFTCWACREFTVVADEDGWKEATKDKRKWRDGVR